MRAADIILMAGGNDYIAEAISACRGPPLPDGRLPELGAAEAHANLSRTLHGLPEQVTRMHPLTRVHLPTRITDR